MKAVISCFAEEGPEDQRSKGTDLRTHSKLRVNIKLMFSTLTIIIARSEKRFCGGLHWLGVYSGSRADYLGQLRHGLFQHPNFTVNLF